MLYTLWMAHVDILYEAIVVGVGNFFTLLPSRVSKKKKKTRSLRHKNTRKI